jgi:dTDP-4-dehydrorhamnose 3,5-epimerase
MTFETIALPGVYLVGLEPIADDRGFFARSWCREEFRACGLHPDLAQCNISFNQRRGTLRGMHYQSAPFEEAKLVRCTRGAILDVVVDLRRDSSTFTRWIGVELSAENRNALYIPEGLAHGFQTLVDDTEVLYQMSVPYAPGASRGVRWDDPAFGIRWPVPDPVLSPKDRAYPDFMSGPLRVTGL